MRTLLAAGTSITAAAYIGAQYSYANLLATQANYDHFYNRGLSGDYAAQLKTRLPALLTEACPTHTILEEGINDVDRASIATFQSDMNDCVSMVLDAGSSCTLAQFNLVRTTPHGLASPPYLQALENIAANRGIPIIRWYALYAVTWLTIDGTTFDALFYDNRHPSISGHALMAAEWNRPQNAAALALLSA